MLRNSITGLIVPLAVAYAIYRFDIATGLIPHEAPGWAYIIHNVAYVALGVIAWVVTRSGNQRDKNRVKED